LLARLDKRTLDASRVLGIGRCEIEVTHIIPLVCE
jgi:ABC-type spermidine/putrescine transport system permease subunit I